jgi:hypothetical protein
MYAQILNGRIIIVAAISILEGHNGFRQNWLFPHRTFILVQMFGKDESSVAIVHDISR